MTNIGQLGGQSYHLGDDGSLTPIPGSPFPNGIPPTDGPFTIPIAGLFSAGQTTDPIVLDMSGDNAGVQLTSLADSDAYFDLHGTGFAVHTGWVGPTTGILVDTSDPASIADLFGNSSTSGFTALKALDVYNSGVLNASDPGWSGLSVWVDANGNGVADAGEVESLSSLGITSISLNTAPENEVVNGNYIGNVATFTTTGDTTGEVAEAYFNNTALDSAVHARRAANDNSACARASADKAAGWVSCAA